MNCWHSYFEVLEYNLDHVGLCCLLLVTQETMEINSRNDNFHQNVIIKGVIVSSLAVALKKHIDTLYVYVPASQVVKNSRENPNFHVNES